MLPCLADGGSFGAVYHVCFGFLLWIKCHHLSSLKFLRFLSTVCGKVLCVLTTSASKLIMNWPRDQTLDGNENCDTSPSCLWILHIIYKDVKQNWLPLAALLMGAPPRRVLDPIWMFLLIITWRRNTELLMYRWQQGRKNSLDLEKEQELLQPRLSASTTASSLLKPGSSRCSFQHPVSAWQHSRSQTSPAPTLLWPWDIASCSGSTPLASSALHHRDAPSGQDRHRDLPGYPRTAYPHPAESLF